MKWKPPVFVEPGDRAPEVEESYDCACCRAQILAGHSCWPCNKRGMRRCGAGTAGKDLCRNWVSQNDSGCRHHKERT
jgi:hypothetical protein